MTAPPVTEPPVTDAAVASTRKGGPSTSLRTGPPLRAIGRRVRTFTLVAGLVVIVALITALFGTTTSHGLLDPRAASPDGARAVAALLGERGITVTTSTDPAAVALPGATADLTIMVPFPARLTSADLGRLARSAALGANVVVVGPDDDALAALGVRPREAGSATVRDRPASCTLPDALTAGSARLGGTVYSGGLASTSCYPAGGGATLFAAFPATPDGVSRGRIVVLGSGGFLTNAHLAQSGDAALAVGLLSLHPSVLWLLPPSGLPGSQGSSKGLTNLLPASLLLAIVQLGIGVVVLAVWRSRRLGPPVPESLPVVVRAAETVEGRGRLYRAAHARGRAADALREGTRARLAETLGLGASAGGLAEPEPAALAAAVSANTGRSPGDIRVLLYGSGMSDPGGDADLVRLADELNDLDRQVRPR